MCQSCASTASKSGVTDVTAAFLIGGYLLLIEAMALRSQGASPMAAKFYSIVLAALVLAPFAYATLNQAAQIVA